MKRIESTPELETLCRKWSIERLSLFGSFAKETQTDSSDVDLLIQFQENSQWNLLDHVRMKREFEEYFGRNVDLISQSALMRMKNQSRKNEISTSLRVIYAA